MSNVFLLRDDNSVQHTVKSAVMEKSSNIEAINFICAKEYNGLNMSTFDLVLTYKLPISKVVKIVTLTLTDADYKDSYLLYSLPVTAKTITSEVGEVELSLMQVKVELNADTGEQTKYVRSYKNAVLNILPVENFLTIDDSGLNQLAELYLANKAQIEALKTVADTIYSTKGDDIVIDSDEKKLKLTSNGEKIGDGIDLNTLSGELVESGSMSDGNINIINI